MRLLVLCLFCCLSAPAGESVLVFAAASMTDALKELGRTYEEKTGVSVVVSIAGSGTLARQIEQGAPADVVILADNVWMDYLEQRQLITASSRRVLLSNNLVMVTNKKKPITLNTEQKKNLSEQFTGRLAIPDPASVPAGSYAQQALTTLGWWNGVSDRLATTGDVRASLRLVERGACDLGIVYASDAHISEAVTVLMRFPDASHKPIHYPVALTKTGTVKKVTTDFLQHLISTDAQAIYKKYGFSVIASP